MEKPYQEDGYCGFDNLPPEIHEAIFNQLDPPTVKLCRLVCSYWNSVLIYGQSRILVYKPIRHAFLAIWEYLKRYVQALLFGVNESQFPFLRANSLHIPEVLHSDCSQLKNWICFYKLQNITCVKLLNCEMDVQTLVSILNLVNLQELSLLDVEYVGLVDQWGNPDRNKASEIRNMHKSLKKLQVRERNLWTLNRHVCTCPLSRFDVLFEALAQGTRNLEILIIECFDTGNPRIDDGRHFSGLFNTLHTFISRNASSLKTLTLNTYNAEDGRRFNYINNQSWDLPKSSSNRVVSLFIDQFRQSQTYQIELPNLSNLSLGFRVVPKYNFQFRETVFPWIRRLKKLKKIHLSQLEATSSFIPRISNLLPQNCHCELEIVSRLNHWPSVNYSYGRMSYLLKRLNCKQNLLLPEPQSSYYCHIAPRGGIGYNDSTVRMKNDKTTWTLLYAQFKRTIQCYTQNLLTLKEFRMQQSGVYDYDKIKITDLDLRTICTNGLKLTHLEFEFCNLSELSDWGLTGISPRVCARMIANNDYNAQLGDLIGPSLSKLQKLRVLKLSFVGNGVTNVTAHHLCKYFPRGLIGEIYGKHKITKGGIRKLSKFLKPTPA